MNIAVINLRKLIRYAIWITLIIVIILIGISALKKEEFDKKVEETKVSFFENFKNSSFLYCLKMELPLISSREASEQRNNDDKSSDKILSSEIALMYSLKEQNIVEQNNTNTVENVQNNEAKIEEKENTETEEDITTEVISDNNIKASYNNEARGVQVNNQTDYDITDIINNSNYEITNKDKIIIYHTHTCESYTSSDKYKYEMTGNYRTTDLNYTVSKVGDELTKCLEEYGKTVIHDKTYHDYPMYNGSYGRSLKTMENILANNKDAEITIDLHRDAVRKQ